MVEQTACHPKPSQPWWLVTVLHGFLRHSAATAADVALSTAVVLPTEWGASAATQPTGRGGPDAPADRSRRRRLCTTRNTRRCSDEAHFWLSRHVNSRNAVHWGSKVPDKVLTKPLHSEKVSAWIAMRRGGGLIGPFFFENEREVAQTINAERGFGLALKDMTHPK
ncbi:hypothetical protein FJT64_025950 [Amphibalanus amphitrite]|uniref:Uncharacterized protein n=1 Tax=Amphibalanus amphitrite TaxID=1232801 RepID=A0A6A4W732_AMPAM|nr:hypothetical protein FJT64_025950 [Amphibalanus amphitrite]